MANICPGGDGGGVRGLSSLVILQEMMRRIENAKAAHIDPYEHFDVIAGTGTGGVSACMLGRLQMPIEKAIVEYVKLTESVFSERKWSGSTMYKGTKLLEALKTMAREATGNEAERMNNGRANNACKTVVFAMARHNLNASLPIMFRSYSVSTNPGPDCTIFEALYATMAHPDLFKSIDIVDSGVSQSFVGGEIGCSNPLAHVLSEVKRVYPDRHVACIISIGAGHARTIQVPDPSRWYRTQDVVVTKEMATDSERVAEEVSVRFEGRSGVYFRFNVDQGMQDIKGGSWERPGEATQHAKAYLQKSESGQKLDAAMRASIERREAISTTHAAGQIPTIFEAAEQIIGLKRCPAPTPFYTGREGENTQVIACITGGKDERRVCVIYGLGGVGKTQLALSVIERTWDKWDHIIYVDASSSEAIEKSLKEFAKFRNIGQSYKDMISWLEACGKRWLLVFDNADSPSTNIRQYIPTGGRGSSVLITTRLSDLAALAVGPGSVCHLSSMSPADGATLLLKVACSRDRHVPNNDTEAAEELVKEFGYLTLAIVHAGAFIAHLPGMTIPKYRSMFLSQRKRMLDEYKQLPETAKLDQRGETVYTTWKMCYEQLKPESRELLWLISYLHYNGITEDMFKLAAQNMHSKKYLLPPTGLESQAREHVQRYLSTFIDSDRSWDHVKFLGVMADLASYSLIDFDRINQTYCVHVLVHDWTKTLVPYSPELAVECAATVCSLSVDRDQGAESLAFKRQLGLHVTSVLAHNPNLGGNHGDYFKEVYSCTGQWIQKAELEQRLLETFKQELGSDHLQTWSVARELAWTYRQLGQWDKALGLQLQVVDACRILLDEEHPDMLASASSLAMIYLDLGQYNKAEQLGVQVLDIRKRVLGEEHVQTLSSMANLALAYSNMGRYSKAEQLKVQELNIRKRIMGEEHPDTLTSMNNLALTYSDLGRHHEAEQLNTHALDMRKHVLGEEHPDTLTSMSNLASNYSDLGRYDKAEELEVQLLDICKHVLGEKHPDTLASMHNYALTYAHLGRYHKAEQLNTHVLDMRKHVLGEEHPETLKSMSNLALTYSDLGQYVKAEQLQIQVLNIRTNVLGEKHPDTLTSMNNLASTYSNLGRYHKAEQLNTHALDMRKHVLGEEHPDTLTSMSNLALNYVHLGRYDKAEELEVQVLNICKHVLGEEHPNTLNYISKLAWIYSSCGQWEKATSLYHTAVSLAEQILGNHHPSTQQFRRDLKQLQILRAVTSVSTYFRYLQPTLPQLSKLSVH